MFSIRDSRVIDSSMSDPFLENLALGSILVGVCNSAFSYKSSLLGEDGVPELGEGAASLRLLPARKLLGTMGISTVQMIVQNIVEKNRKYFRFMMF